MTPDQLIAPSSEDAQFLMIELDLMLGAATDTFGPGTVIEMLRQKADVIEAISTRRMH